jgi:hypothetical protein
METFDHARSILKLRGAALLPTGSQLASPLYETEFVCKPRPLMA